MTSPSKDVWYDRFRPANNWNLYGALLCPTGNWDDYLIRVKVKTSAEIGVCEFADAVETAGDETDLTIVTTPADNSVVPLLYIPDTEDNRNQLAYDNSADSYSSLTKSTAKFTTGSYIDAYILSPGMVLTCKAANSQTIKPGSKVQNAGTATVDVYATVNARIGHVIGQILSEAALHWFAVMITF